MMVMRALWSVVTLPFRLIGRAAGMVGRLVGATLGFALMVVGAFLLCFQHIWFVGLPVFLFALLLTLRSLR
jgi:hypothetical protein